MQQEVKTAFVDIGVLLALLFVVLLTVPQMLSSGSTFQVVCGVLLTICLSVMTAGTIYKYAAYKEKK